MRLPLTESPIKGSAFCACIIACSAWAQQPMAIGSAGSNRAAPLPLFGRTNQAGAANAQQSAARDGVTSSI
jgi:hypothetical protein